MNAIDAVLIYSCCAWILKQGNGDRTVSSTCNFCWKLNWIAFFSGARNLSFLSGEGISEENLIDHTWMDRRSRKTRFFWLWVGSEKSQWTYPPWAYKVSPWVYQDWNRSTDWFPFFTPANNMGFAALTLCHSVRMKSIFRNRFSFWNNLQGVDRFQ